MMSCKKNMHVMQGMSINHILATNRVILNFAGILNKLEIGVQINKQSNTMILVGSIAAKSSIGHSVV